MKLIIGLGNPGVKYKKTRHNVGFSAVGTLCKHYNATNVKDRFGGHFSKSNTLGEELLFFTPMSFMNNSGIPVNKIINFYKILLDDVYVIVDDLDLKVKKIRIKLGGNHNGHNGLNSINQYIGNQYTKIKIGIGKPNDNTTINKYVLSQFQSNELELMDKIYSFLSTNFSMIIKNEFLNFY